MQQHLDVTAGNARTCDIFYVNDMHLNMENEKEGLEVGVECQHLVDHNSGPVKVSDVTDNTVESSEVVQSESVAVATPKEVA